MVLRDLVPSSLFLPLFSFFQAEKNPAFLISLAEFKDVMITLFQEKLPAFQTVLRHSLSMGILKNIW